MSFAVLYFRLLPSDLSRRMNQVLLVVLALEGIVATLVVSLQCIPLQKAWNPALDGACLDLRTFYYISVGILDIKTLVSTLTSWLQFGVKLITDICLFVQPIPAVWGLPLSLEKRIGAILMLSLGLL
jgi:rhodopsin domain-containing protein